MALNSVCYLDSEVIKEYIDSKKPRQEVIFEALREKNNPQVPEALFSEIIVLLIQI